MGFPLYLGRDTRPALLVSFAMQDAKMSDDHAAVEAAVLDYVEGIYDVEPDRIERSVHKDLKKYGFLKEGADAPYQGMPMTYDQLHALAGKNRGRDWPKENETSVDYYFRFYLDRNVAPGRRGSPWPGRRDAQIPPQ